METDSALADRPAASIPQQLLTQIQAVSLMLTQAYDMASGAAGLSYAALQPIWSNLAVTEAAAAATWAQGVFGPSAFDDLVPAPVAATAPAEPVQAVLAAALAAIGAGSATSACNILGAYGGAEGGGG